MQVVRNFYLYFASNEQCPSILSNKNRLSINPNFVKTKPIKTAGKNLYYHQINLSDKQKAVENRCRVKET